MLENLLNFLNNKLKKLPSNKPTKSFSLKRLGIEKNYFSYGAIQIIKNLQKNGFNAFVVGGAVRDLIIGIKPKDFDVVTNAKPEQIKKIFRRSRIIGKRFKIVHVYVRDETIEVSTFRSKCLNDVTVDNHGRITRDNSFGEQDEDASRRDLTINALYLDPLKGQVFDYHNGISDINNKTIKMIGDSSDRYREDPVRMLRVLRFSVKLNFKIESETYINIKKNASLITGIPKSRLIDEVVKLLLTGNSMKGMKELWSTKLYLAAFPLLEDIFNNSRILPHSNLTVENFLNVAFELIDKRVNSKKTISIGFIFACLLWYKLLEIWDLNKTNGLREIPALHDAINKIINESFISFPIQRRYLADMKEIWLLQPRFEKRKGKAPFRLIKNLKFRAALNFLKLRSNIRMANSELPIWWESFSTHNEEGRINLINSISTLSSKKINKKKSKLVENNSI